MTSKRCGTTPEECLEICEGILEICETFLCSHSDGRCILLVAIKDAGLSAMHETFPHHEDLSCVSYEYWCV